VRISTVFNKLLSLQGAWVRKVRFGAEEVVVTVEKRARRHRCPRCRFSTRTSYDGHEGRWRHVGLGKWRVVIAAALRRITCPTHGVITEAVPWAVSGSRFTLDFEDLVAWLAREMNKTAVTKLARVTWRAVGRIITRVVGRKLDKGRLDALFVIGLDEVSYRKGHKYLSIVADHAKGDPAWIGEGRSQETVGKFFDELGPERAAKIEFVTMDMSAAFIGEVHRRAPQAEIVFDPFHVVKLAGDAVHKLRRDEARATKGTPEAAVLKGSRWALLKAEENLRPDEEAKLADVAALNRRVYRGYLLKEELRALYRCTSRGARAHLRRWLGWASRSKLRPFVKLAQTLRRHQDGVLAAVDLGLSNGRLEGLNNKIGVLKHRAYGFHSAAALIAMIFLCCTNLHVTLPT
jgi:transposase